MARLIITTFQTQPQHVQTVELGGVRLRLRLTFLERPRAWYLDILREDGTAIATGRRLSPAWGPLFGIPVDDGPAGSLYVRGPDPYVREDLGTLLLLVFSPTADLPAPTPAPDAPVVVVTSP